MDNLKINHFKCFDSLVELDLGGRRNLLLCGENGAGKSSLFESIKLVYYRDRLLPNTVEIVGPAAPNVNQANQCKKYCNKKNPQTPFEILVDGVDYKQYEITTDAFFISCENLKEHDEISLDVIFGNLFFPETVIDDVDSFWSDEFLQYVNDSLHDDFFENVHLEILQGGGHFFRIIDEIQGINEYNHLGDSYNEAKLNIVLLVILFQIILCSPVVRPRLLVLDDIINSLDMANRGLVAKFVMTHFHDCQILLFTHNVSFYNLFSYAIMNYKNVGTWEKRLLYEVGDTRVLVKDESPETVASIKADFDPKQNNCEPIGNRVRKLFEYLLHEYARLMQFGDFMETSAILNKIVNTDASKVFLKISGDKVYTVEDLLLSIKGIVGVAPSELIREKINKQFLEYDCSHFFNGLIPVVQDLTLFQKLTLHQLSHDQNQLPTFSTHEIEYSLFLLEKLEKVINGLKNMNSNGNVYRI